MPGFVSLVGAGPWDPGLLTLAGRDRLARADVVIADYLANPALFEHCRPDARVIQRRAGPRHGADLKQPQIHALLLEHAKAGRYVVRLKGGDPTLFGRGGEEARLLHQHGIPFEIVPGVPSALGAAAAAGICVTHRDHTPAVTIVSGYEAFDKSGQAVAWHHLAHAAGTLVFLMGIANLRENMARLVEAGRAPDTPAAAVRWGTRGIQRTVVATVGTLADAVARAGLRAPALVVVGDVVRLRDEIAFLERRPLFGRRIVVARARARGNELAERLATLGADVVLFPCLDFAPMAPPTAPTPAELADRVARCDGVILSSPEGARRLQEGLLAAGTDLRALSGKLVAAIGTGTERALTSMGIRPDLVPERANSEGLAQALGAADLARRTWLHVRGSEGREILAHSIEAAGGTYLRAVLYRTLRPAVSPVLARSLLPADEGGEGVSAVFAGSGRALRNLRTTLEEHLGADRAHRLLADADLYCMGPVTTAAARSMGLRPTKVAASPTVDDVVAMFSDPNTVPPLVEPS